MLEVVPITPADTNITEDSAMFSFEFFFSGASAIAEGVTVSVFFTLEDGNAVLGTFLHLVEKSLCNPTAWVIIFGCKLHSN